MNFNNAKIYNSYMLTCKTEESQKEKSSIYNFYFNNKMLF